MRIPALLTAIAALSFACNDGGDGNTGTTDDTDGPNYEDGCIDVSSASQGFASPLDAITVAQDGDTITLCDDVNVPLVVDKALTIVGNGVILTPPPNEMAIVIKETGALTIDNVEIQTTRSGVIVEAGGELNADNIDITTVENYGFDIAAGAKATINDATINAPEWGGFRVIGGDATITNASVADAGAFGVFADESAVVSVSDSTFTNIAHRDSSTQLWDIDGVGVWVEGGSSVTMSGNVITAAEISGVSVDGSSSLTMDGDQIAGLGRTFAAVAVRQSSFTADNISVADYGQYGMLALSADSIEVGSSSFTVQEGLSAPNQLNNPDDPEDDRIGSVGLYILDSELSLTGTEELPSVVSGHNGAGVLVSPSGGGTTSGLVMDHVNIVNNGAFGVTVYSGEATVSNSTISATRNDDEYCSTATGYRCNMAFGLWTSEGDFTNTRVEDNGDWGVTVVNGVVTTNGGTFARNETNSIFVQSSALTVDGTVFEQGRTDHINAQQGSTILIDNATFRDGEYTRETEFESGERLIRQVNYYQARDMFVSGSDLTISNTTFENGQNGLYLSGNDATPVNATITDTTFTNYNAYGSYNFGKSDVTLERVTFDQIGRYAMYCYECDLEAKDVSITNMTAYKYRFEYYTDGELQFDNEFEQPDPAINVIRGDISLEDVTITNSASSALVASDSTVEMDGVTIKDMVNGEPEPAAVSLTWSDTTIAPNAVLNALSIEGPVGFTPEEATEPLPVDALRLTGWSDRTTGEQADGVIEVIDLLITNDRGRGVTGAGLVASNLANLSITGLDIDTTGGAGLSLDQVSGEITGAALSRSGIISTTGAEGIRIDSDRGTFAASSLTISDVSVSDTALDGINANAGMQTWSSVSVTGAGGFGAVCTDVTFSTCDASLDGVEGATDGCDACIPAEE